ncbi:XAP5-domain-containing protein [Aulographum hederae CBS 113979]|uniref:XAP5-domain-containing protein n=1 Tax=Aulographum hederae CBS 113979 TaxID=1176131 RepID=A0A6G1GVL1_9PEZI|nr:XAP5-domain-containing protein [Aulographum hederae CBS 113979]
MASDPPPDPASGTSTPSAFTNPRFTSQSATAEDLLKSETVGLVQLNDFRKRRAKVLEQKAHDESLSRIGMPGSGTSTPADGSSTPLPAKKKRKALAKGKLSFDLDDDEDETATNISAAATPRSNTPSDLPTSADASATDTDGALNFSMKKKKIVPNAAVNFTPKAQTKSALLREAQTREQLRKEFLQMQEAVKATEFMLPFVFYDGSVIPGGKVRVRKGDHVWFFLDRARKVGAAQGGGGTVDEGAKRRREWARVGVDDLMLVRGEMIIPHHFEFYYFMLNKTTGYGIDGPLFPFSPEPTSATPFGLSATEKSVNLSTYDPLAKPKTKSKTQDSSEDTISDTDLEGFLHDPTTTKVVDRRWYEKQKHIYPMSMWETFEIGKVYGKGARRDANGNAMFGA